MTCKTVILAGGLRAIVCSRRRARRCRQCGRPSTLLCDFPKPSGKTCDAPLCARCAVPIGPDRDHCPNHPADPQHRLEGF